MVTQETPQVFLGLDVGKSEHWACAITSGRKVIWNKALPNDEAKLVDMYRALTLVLGHADSSTLLGKRESKDGKEELHRRVPSPGGGLV